MENNTSNQTNSQGIVTIHGKQYVTVAERVRQAHEGKSLTITTEILSNDPVVIKATVVTDKGTFTGISSVSLTSVKFIEKSNPYEVAETSAVGRALGFAGYGVIESIASADEITKSDNLQETTYTRPPSPRVINHELAQGSSESKEKKVCSAHDEPQVMFRGESKTKLDDEGNPKVYWWHKNDQGQMCFGTGYKD